MRNAVGTITRYGFKTALLFFFLSLFLFILPLPINATHLSGCVSACGTFGCAPNEEFCDDFANDEEFCAAVSRCSSPTPTTAPACGGSGQPCCGPSCNPGLICAPDGFCDPLSFPTPT